MIARESRPGRPGAAQNLDATNVFMSTIVAPAAVEYVVQVEPNSRNRSARSFFEGQNAIRRILADPDETIALMTRRAVTDVIARLTASQWEQRARVLEDAMSRPGDYLGNSTPAERRTRDRRLADDAARCRCHADLLRSLHAEGVAL